MYEGLRAAQPASERAGAWRQSEQAALTGKVTCGNRDPPTRSPIGLRLAFKSLGGFSFFASAPSAQPSLARHRTEQPVKLLGATSKLLADSPLRPPKSYAFTAAIIINENNAGSFQRLTKRCLVDERNWNFPVHNLCSPDRRYSDF